MTWSKYSDLCPTKAKFSKPSDTRKVRKPLMERKRRARINQSLDRIKEILMEAKVVPNHKEGKRPSKLEKADILDLTIRYIESIAFASHQSSIPQNNHNLSTINNDNARLSLSASTKSTTDSADCNVPEQKHENEDCWSNKIRAKNNSGPSSIYAGDVETRIWRPW